LSADELAQRRKLAVFLDKASEDDFIEKVIVPPFQRLGFRRVSPTGHKEKALEFDKDLWMKFQLPTSHWLYFCAQVKKDKIDSSGTGGSHNVATVLRSGLWMKERSAHWVRSLLRLHAYSSRSQQINGYKDKSASRLFRPHN